MPVDGGGEGRKKMLKERKVYSKVVRKWFGKRSAVFS